jgi:aminoglycoside 3-N-acetyltransferase
MVVTKADIASGFVNLGLGRGDLVTMHSSLKSLGQVAEGAHTVIDALREVLGAEGTILMPAFSFSLKAQENPVFDVAETPSCVGAVTEIFRKEYATHRSLHLSHSYSAAGPLAKELTTHPLDITPCGKESPIARFLARGGKILLLGAGYNSCTAFHAIEEKMCVPYMAYVLRTDAAYRRDGCEYPLPSRTLVRGFSYDFTVLDKDFRDRGVLRETKIGDADVMLLDGRGFSAIVEDKLKNDAGIFFRGYK